MHTRHLRGFASILIDFNKIRLLTGCKTLINSIYSPFHPVSRILRTKNRSNHPEMYAGVVDAVAADIVRDIVRSRLD